MSLPASLAVSCAVFVSAISVSPAGGNIMMCCPAGHNTRSGHIFLVSRACRDQQYVRTPVGIDDSSARSSSTLGERVACPLALWLAAAVTGASDCPTDKASNSATA